MKKLQELFSKINNFVNKNYFIVNNPPVITFTVKDGFKSAYINVPGFNMQILNNPIWEDVKFEMDECNFSVRVSDLNNVFSSMRNKDGTLISKSDNNIKFESIDGEIVEIPQCESVKPKGIRKCSDECVVVPVDLIDSVLYRARACFYTVNHTPVYNTIKVVSFSGASRFVSGNGSIFCIQDIKCEVPDGKYCIPYSCLSFLHELNKITRDKKVKFISKENSFHVENDYFIMNQEVDLDFSKWPDENKILDMSREISLLMSSDVLKGIRDNLQLSMIYKKDDELLITDFSADKSFSFITDGKIKTKNSVEHKSCSSPFSGRIYTRLLLDLVNSMPDDDVEALFTTSSSGFRGKNFPLICEFNDGDAMVSIICTQV